MMRLLVALAGLAGALQPPPSLSKGGTSLKFDAADAMADMIAAQHALKLESVRKAKEEVYASYAEKIAALEQELAARTEVPIYSSHAEAAPAAPPKPAAAAPGPELTFLEYPQTPASKFKPTQPLESTVMSVKRAIGPDAPGEICHIALQTGGRLPYVEGQSIGVLPCAAASVPSEIAAATARVHTPIDAGPARTPRRASPTSSGSTPSRRRGTGTTAAARPCRSASVEPCMWTPKLEKRTPQKKVSARTFCAIPSPAPP